VDLNQGRAFVAPLAGKRDGETISPFIMGMDTRPRDRPYTTAKSGVEGVYRLSRCGTRACCRVPCTHRNQRTGNRKISGKKESCARVLPARVLPARACLSGPGARGVRWFCERCKQQGPPSCNPSGRKPQHYRSRHFTAFYTGRIQRQRLHGPGHAPLRERGDGGLPCVRVGGRTTTSVLLSGPTSFKNPNLFTEYLVNIR
jgi:hypothetical protein